MSDVRPAIICFHGSPGTPDDFLELQGHLLDYRLIRPVRRGYPADRRALIDDGIGLDSPILLGYSWGGLVALRHAAQAPARVTAVILVAPCLYPRAGRRLLQVIVRMPWLGHAILARKGPSFVANLLVETAYPCDVPSSYHSQRRLLARPKSLRRAILEKSEPGLPTHEALDAVRARDIPLAVIRGAEDRTCPQAEQIRVIRERVPRVIDRCLDGAGHALPWTHPAEVAEAIQSILAQIQSIHQRVEV